jgi:hypothetical protein
MHTQRVCRKRLHIRRIFNMAFGFLNYLAKYHVPSFANLDFGILHKYGAPSRDEDYLARFRGHILPNSAHSTQSTSTCLPMVAASNSNNTNKKKSKKGSKSAAKSSKKRKTSKKSAAAAAAKAALAHTAKTASMQTALCFLPPPSRCLGQSATRPSQISRSILHTLATLHSTLSSLLSTGRHARHGAAARRGDRIVSGFSSGATIHILFVLVVDVSLH